MSFCVYTKIIITLLFICKQRLCSSDDSILFIGKSRSKQHGSLFNQELVYKYAVGPKSRCVGS